MLGRRRTERVAGGGAGSPEAAAEAGDELVLKKDTTTWRSIDEKYRLI